MFFSGCVDQIRFDFSVNSASGTSYDTGFIANMFSFQT